MTKEEKQLLLKDICPRFPYKVKVHTRWLYQETDGKLKYKEKDRVFEINDLYSIWDVKPYLRPMSSMTDEEYKEYDNAIDLDVKDSSETLKENLKAKTRVRVSKWYHGNDWLNAHHFDYRGLIDKGLALEAPADMYKNEKI